MTTKRKIAGHKVLSPDTIFASWAALKLYAEWPDDDGTVLDIGHCTARPGEKLADILADVARERNSNLRIFATEPLA